MWIITLLLDYIPTFHGKYNNFVHVIVNFPKRNDKKFIIRQKQKNYNIMIGFAIYQINDSLVS